MTMKSQLRSAKNPGTFIDLARQAFKKNEDPNVIVPEHFGEMTAMIFQEVCTNSAKDFNAMYGFATHARQNGRLMAPFYRAAQAGFGDISVEFSVRPKQWPEFFSGIAQTIHADKRLTVIVNKETVLKALPNLVWSINPTKESIAAATGILKSLGEIPGTITGLDPAIVDELVKQHIAGEDAPIKAAPKLMELRTVPLFEEAIAANENARGIHIGAATRVVNAGRYDEEAMTFAFEFNRFSDDLQIYQLHLRRNGWMATMLKDEEDRACREHGELAADALIDYSLKPLPGQEWVKSIAERCAFELV